MVCIRDQKAQTLQEGMHASPCPVWAGHHSCFTIQLSTGFCTMLLFVCSMDGEQSLVMVRCTHPLNWSPGGQRSFVCGLAGSVPSGNLSLSCSLGEVALVGDVWLEPFPDAAGEGEC